MTLRVIAHNIRSMFNIGAIFRNSDAFGVDHVYLSGYTATPPRSEISKTALGADESVSWSHEEDAVSLIKRLQAEGKVVVAFEADSTFESIGELALSFPDDTDIVALFGNEPDGVPEDLLALADRRSFIPMMGAKSSLNVSVASGVALWKLSRQKDPGSL